MPATEPFSNSSSSIRPIAAAFAGIAFAAAFGLLSPRAMGQAAEPAADQVLINGKVITVDDQFRIVQALAIRGERIVAAASNAEIKALTGPSTRVVDLQGRTVIPGLIDNHAHYMRSGEYWDREVRLDGVTSHKEALDLIAAKARQSRHGEWVLVLGGWAEEQFTDEKRGFTKAELDAVAPENPVVLQLIYFRVYLNTAAMKALGIDRNAADPRNGKIDKNADGEPTGMLNGGGAVGYALSRLGEVDRERMVQNARALSHDLNRMGITAYLEMGGRGFSPAHFQAFQTLAQAKEATVRAFYNYWQDPSTPAEAERAAANVARVTPFQGDDWLDNVGYGETVYFPIHDNLLAKSANPSPEGLKAWRGIAQAVAERGLHLNVHAQLRNSIEAFLGEIESINRIRPIKALRWTFSHADQLSLQDIERMRKLGMYVQLHSRPTIQGALMLKIHGDRTYDMPPLRMVQDSGLPWGLGSDATAVTPTNPFYTLGWAVTGKMIGGTLVLKQTITREQALIAHTRANSYFLFQEANLGALAPGKYADLLVLDRDYLAVPADDIKDIKPLLTMVGGRVVYDALPK